MKTQSVVVDATLAAGSIAALGAIRELHDFFAFLGALVMFCVAVARLLLLIYELRERKHNAQAAQKPAAPQQRGDSQAE